MFKALMVAAAVFVALPASAQDAAPVARRAAAEVSRDAFLTRSATRAERRFTRIDADGNGLLSHDERAADRAASRARWVARQAQRAAGGR